METLKVIKAESLLNQQAKRTNKQDHGAQLRKGTYSWIQVNSRVSTRCIPESPPSITVFSISSDNNYWPQLRSFSSPVVIKQERGSEWTRLPWCTEASFLCVRISFSIQILDFGFSHRFPPNRMWSDVTEVEALKCLHGLTCFSPKEKESNGSFCSKNGRLVDQAWSQFKAGVQPKPPLKQMLPHLTYRLVNEKKKCLFF